MRDQARGKRQGDQAAFRGIDRVRRLELQDIVLAPRALIRQSIGSLVYPAYRDALQFLQAAGDSRQSRLRGLLSSADLQRIPCQIFKAAQETFRSY